MDDVERQHGLNWVSRVQRKLRTAGLRLTQQRLLLASLLFNDGERHVTAETLHEEAVARGMRVSLATVYNTLHQFAEARLVRSLAVEAPKAYFDTNTSDHHHFLVEGEDRIMDIPGGVDVKGIPAPPPGMEIANIDVVVRLRRGRTGPDA